MSRYPLAIVLALTLAVPQDLPRARALLEQALRELQAPTPIAAIATPAALDAALATAAPGAILTLSPTLIYPSPLTLQQSVTLQTVVPLARMDAVTPLPSFRGGLTITGDDVTVIGIEVRHTNPLTDIVTFSGARVTLDRVRILGDVTTGAKRGIAANGNGACVIRRSYVDDCFQASPGNDSQAVIAWDMAPGLTIEDNFLRAGSETVLLGGADSSSLARMPTDVTIRGNTITARPEWMGRAIGVKTRIEVKAARRVLIERNVIEYCWKQGQGGYLVSFTVRNQGGRAPWSTIEDVVFTDNDVAHGSGALNVLALDDNQPSVRLSRVSIRGNRFSDLSPTAYGGGSNRMIQISGGSRELSIDANTFAGTGIGSVVYFTGLQREEQLTITNNTWPRSTYGIFGSSATVGQAWAKFVVTGTLSGNVVTP